MSRPLFMLRPNLRNAEHRKAWEVLQAVEEGQKSAFLVRAILETVRKEELEQLLRRVIREEIQAVPSRPVQEPEAGIPQEMMGFLGSLLDEE